MKTDPKNKKASTTPKSAAVGGKKNYEVTQKDGSKVNVSKSLKTAGQEKTGILKSRGTYKGKELKDDSGKVFGIKLNDGTVKKSNGNRKVMGNLSKELGTDKKLFDISDTEQKARQKRIGSAKYKPKTQS